MSTLRKYALPAAAVVLAAGGAAFLLTRSAPPAPGPPAAPPADVNPGWTAAAETDPVEVFQRAFWRRPEEEDRILKAERVQWSADRDGVRKWQWFLAVQPGPGLEGWLRDSNPFSLRKAESYHAATDSALSRRPAWFPEQAAAGEWDIFRGGTMTLLFRKADRQLFATDAGGGFTEPARR